MKAPLTQLQSFARKSDEVLRYIIKDAREAANNMRGFDPKAEAKYLDQINDASTVLARRARGLQRVRDTVDVNECGACGGELVYLGCLGNREHLRCRQCGCDFSRKESD